MTDITVSSCFVSSLLEMDCFSLPQGAVESLGRDLSEVFSVCLYVSRMSDFAAINAVYKTYFGVGPPVR